MLPEDWKQQLNALYVDAVHEMRGNLRLRIGGWAIILIALGYPILLMQDSKAESHAELQRLLTREAKIDRVKSETGWVKRVDLARSMLDDLERQVGRSPSLGVAKVTAAQQIDEWAMQSQLENPKIRFEEPIKVKGFDNLYRVVGTLDATFSEGKLMTFLKLVEENPVKMVVERLDIEKRGNFRLRMSLVMFFRLLEDDESPLGKSRVDEVMMGGEGE